MSLLSFFTDKTATATPERQFESVRVRHGRDAKAKARKQARASRRRNRT